VKQKIKRFSELLLFALLFWSFVFCLFILIRYTWVGAEEGIRTQPEYKVSIIQWLDIGVILGFVVGFFYTCIEWLFERYVAKKLYLGLSILFKTFFYVFLLILSLSLTTKLVEYRMDIDLPNQLGWWRTNPVFWLAVGYFLIWSLVFSFIKIAVENFGKEVFFNMLIGKYRKPREEKRIFMFLDLKASTTIAEEIGDFNYSQLIQDCFLDLNEVLFPYGASIYQYVGDEAVLSWDYSKGIQKNNCIQLFFAFQKRLQKRASYYKKKYKRLPQFKAGVHGGKLIVVEVGSIKKELAYHGDVINTTSRIQEQCNVHTKKLLLSQELASQMNLFQYSVSEIGELGLKGKQHKLRILALDLK